MFAWLASAHTSPPSPSQEQGTFNNQYYCLGNCLNSVFLFPNNITYCLPFQSKTFQEDKNVSEGFHANYSVTFNIILWLLIVMAVVIYAVAYGIWYMDPGHDSIIYRMTSQRMKRD